MTCLARLSPTLWKVGMVTVEEFETTPTPSGERPVATALLVRDAASTSAWATACEELHLIDWPGANEVCGHVTASD
jgi:hypothetical protein